MIQVNNIEVMNINGAMRGMRNPLESWYKNDSNDTVIGHNDLELAKKLVAAGSDHCKFMRHIIVCMDITAPMSWWWDMDTYKVGTTKNSTSRMHKLGSRLLTSEDFSWDSEEGTTEISHLRAAVLENLNDRILIFQETKCMAIWRSILMDLPQSYNFLATWVGNYQVMRSVYHARKNHKQREFRDFCKVIEKLPYSELITA